MRFGLVARSGGHLEHVVFWHQPEVVVTWHGIDMNEIFLPNERVAVFVDGAGLYSTSRNLGFDVDYRDLREFFLKRCQLVRIYYYAAVLETEDYSPLKPLTDWLAYNGYTLITKAAKEFTDSAGRRRVKGNMEVEIAVDMLELAPRIDHAVLISGDADFRRLIEAMQRRGVRTSVISSLKTAPPSIADELRRQADQFIELADIGMHFTRRRPEVRPEPEIEADDTPAGAVVISDRRPARVGMTARR